MGLAQRVEFEYDRIEHLRRDFQKADDRFRSYKLIKNQDRIETVFERLRQERAQALARYKQAIAEAQIESIQYIMSQKQLPIVERMLQAVQDNSLKAFALWVWAKI